MNTAAIWTLWLIVHAAGGGATPVVTPLATFGTAQECVKSIDGTTTILDKQFPQNPPVPGLLICVYGTPVKR